MTPDEQLSTSIARLRHLADKLEQGTAYLDESDYRESDERGYHRITLTILAIVPVRFGEKKEAAE